MTTADWMPALGEMLFHQLWQGLALFAAAAFCIRRMRGLSAAGRYWAWTATATAIVLLPLSYFAPRPAPPEWLAGLWSAPAIAATPNADRNAFIADAPGVIDWPGMAGPIANPAAKPETSGSASLPRHWVAALLAVWAAAALWNLARVLSGLLLLRRLKRDAAPLPPEHPLTAWLAGRAREAKLARTVQLKTSTAIAVPAALGFRRPIIALPENLLRELNHQELKQVIMHELAHILRKDDWANLFQKLAGALLCHHPGFLGASRRMELERETACDAWAAARTGNAKSYANCLVKVFESLRRVPRTALAVGAVAGGGQLSHRVDSLLRPAAGKAKRGGLAAFLTLLSFAFVSLACAAPRGSLAMEPSLEPAAMAQTEPQDEPQPEPNRADNRHESTTLMEAVERGEIDEETALRRLEAAQIAVKNLELDKESIMRQLEETARQLESGALNKEDMQRAMETAERSLETLSRDKAMWARQAEAAKRALEETRRSEEAAARGLEDASRVLESELMEKERMLVAMERANLALEADAIDEEALARSLESLRALDEEAIAQSLEAAKAAMEAQGIAESESASAIAAAKEALAAGVAVNIEAAGGLRELTPEEREKLKRTLAQAREELAAVEWDKAAMAAQLETARKTLAEVDWRNQAMMREELERMAQTLSERGLDQEAIKRELGRAKAALEDLDLDAETIRSELSRAREALKDVELDKAKMLEELARQRQELERRLRDRENR